MNNLTHKDDSESTQELTSIEISAICTAIIFASSKGKFHQAHGYSRVKDMASAHNKLLKMLDVVRHIERKEVEAQREKDYIKCRVALDDMTRTSLSNGDRDEG